MKTVWKFPVPSGLDAPPILLPVTAEIVHVSVEPGQGEPTAWIELDTAQSKFPRQVGFVGTGQAVPDRWKHRGTCISPAGFVWHVYEGDRR